jgi:hypothetical protein
MQGDSKSYLFSPGRPRQIPKASEGAAMFGRVCIYRRFGIDVWLHDIFQSYCGESGIFKYQCIHFAIEVVIIVTAL